MNQISLARGVPAPDCLPEEELADCARAILESDGATVLSYGSGAGYLPLREVIAGWHGVDSSRVVLTNGGLQGFVLLCQHFGRGATVFVESPTYDRPLKILTETGLNTVPVAMDDEGVIPAALQKALKLYPNPAFIYLIPTFQNPSGRTLSLERRREIVAIAEEAGVKILEDDPYGKVRFDGEALPSLFDLAPDTVMYASSFSKTVSPGLRVGWYVLPTDIAEMITARATSTYITPVQLGEAVIYEFIRRGNYEPNIEKVNALLKERRDAMLAALEKYLPTSKWSKPEGGYFVWLELPEGTDAKEILESAEGVTAVLGSDFGGAANTIRLAYSYVSPEEIDTGIERLAAALDA